LCATNEPCVQSVQFKEAISKLITIYETYNHFQVMFDIIHYPVYVHCFPKLAALLNNFWKTYMQYKVTS